MLSAARQYNIGFVRSMVNTVQWIYKKKVIVIVDVGVTMANGIMGQLCTIIIDCSLYAHVCCFSFCSLMIPIYIWTTSLENR